MESCNESYGENSTIEWHIENFHFCWHRTGERLESPLFNINIPSKTSWRFWLYPRGEDDGEYISCYLFRAEEGPEVVHVDFSLGLFVRETILTSPVSFSKIYSFKSCQREGLKRFASRYEVFAPVAAEKNGVTLIISCHIFNPEIVICEIIMLTRIEMGNVCGTEILDVDADLDPKRNKDIEVKPILEDEPLINVNLSYVGESLVIKIHPVRCKEIKFATCKITVIKNWGKETLIEYVRSWIGEIKTDIWRYHVPRLEFETFTQKAFLLHYDLAFSTGVVMEKYGFEECDSYMTTSSIFVQHCFNSNIKTLESARTALEALGDVYRSRSYTDLNIKTRRKTFFLHTAIICSRSSRFKSMLKNCSSELQFSLTTINRIEFEHFFPFLYTDTMDFLHWKTAFELYNFASFFDVELLRIKCRNFLTDNLDQRNVCLILHLSRSHRDLAMKAVTENYILLHYDLILTSVDWEDLVNHDPELLKEIILLKYKKKNTMH